MSIVRNILSHKNRPNLCMIGAADTVNAAIKVFSEHRFRCLPVLDGEQLVGVVTVRDLMRYLAANGAKGMGESVAGAMTRNPTTASVTDSIDKVDEQFTGKFNHLPVLDGTTVVGVLTPSDILSHRLGDVRALATDLERYITGH